MLPSFQAKSRHWKLGLPRCESQLFSRTTWSWANHLTSLTFRFLFYNRGHKSPTPHHEVVGVRGMIGVKNQNSAWLSNCGALLDFIFLFPGTRPILPSLPDSILSALLGGACTLGCSSVYPFERCFQLPSWKRSTIHKSTQSLMCCPSRSICIPEEGEALAMRNKFLGGNLRYHWSAGGKCFLYPVEEY